ncbi:ribonuclease P [Candidatus Woesearchaeota archaeon]|nr:ribonuclease P [Candidatus Woesearchaeota archaeon]
MRKHLKKPVKQQKIALERIQVLFKEAKLMFHEDSMLSRRYVQLARKIAMKYKVRFPSELKRKFCKKCNSYFVAENSKIRVKQGYLIFHCLGCKTLRKVVYKH